MSPLHSQLDAATELEQAIREIAAPSLDCGEDPIAALKTMFVDMAMGARIQRGQEPVQRPVFLKPHGAARGIFTIRPELPAELRLGLFRYESFAAWIRFASDTVPTLPDLKTTLGIAIKLFGVPGEKLLENEPHATTHDLIMQNHDVFFVDTAKDMCEFTFAGVVNGDYAAYLAAHPRTAQILTDMQKTVSSVLHPDYWSVLPYAFGETKYVKYKLSPCAPPTPGTEPDTNDPSYLHADLKQRLAAGEVCFNFYIQLQTDPATMPLDQATVRWGETASPPIHVATLTIPQQDIDARGQAAYGENLSFNPWRALPEHMPVGSIAQARKVVYAAAAELRRNLNGVPLGEPVEVRPSQITAAQPRDTKIVRAVIHPAIGVARVGNSPEEYFLGPETLVPPRMPVGFYKDHAGALKRQAARFRVYGYNGAGEVVRELTADNADLRWTVHLANQKAAWYQFQLALDIPEANASDLDPTVRRNQAVVGVDRQKLVIDPGPRSIRGRETSGPAYAFDTGAFFGKPVYLGELRTDDAGRLIVLGGRGFSASSQGPEATPTTFANNDTWHDDTSDGPVTAEVRLNGVTIPVDPAWVIVAPPNYAPEVEGVRTMYDLIYDSFVQAGRLPFPATISFTQDVYPILRRLFGLQWVNQGFAIHFGAGGWQNFLEPAYLAQLASNAPEQRELRQQVFNQFRSYERDGAAPGPWPWLYGDAMNVPAAATPRQHVALEPTQYRILEKWAAGQFTADWAAQAAPVPIAEAPLNKQPAILDRAALSYCLADAFHPGCEMTWVMRHVTMYTVPFRILHRPANFSEPNYGARLTPEVVLQPDGMLYGQSPGSLTRWMAVPWQTDTASCRSGYYAGYGPRYDPYLPTFWPARVPNHVLTEENYRIAVDASKPRAERLRAFRQRASWFRALSGDYFTALAEMITKFGQLGVVEARPGVENDPELPDVMLVESRPGFPAVEIVPAHRNLLLLNTADVPAGEVAAAVEATGLPEEAFTTGGIEKVRRFRNVR